MKLRLYPVVLFLLFLGFSSCQGSDHFIADKKYRKKVREQFAIQKELAKNRSDTLFKVFDLDLSLTEKEALEFLYAYMPLSDLADYDGDFYLKNVRASLAARDTFSWGKTVPEDLFRHFVLPVRVNNENLDSSRWVFFMELKDRIKKMTMKEAALEVNHWCHEKVTYRGSDGRTSSALASVKTAFGRCGEESTFTTAAMRSVGIPARQCYTPRWAHTDDNHAWVEIWIDGKWHFIGACEPEADLDLAWFAGPAKRAMLVNTNVFGDYSGPEDILIKDSRYTKINTLSNYTTTKRVTVRVLDEKRAPVDSAAVEFQLYNYAEFYPLHRVVTGKDGLAGFTTGMGDLLVWAARKDKFGFQKVSVKNQDTIALVLNETKGVVRSMEIDLTPPPEISVSASVSDSLKSVNTRRLEFEDKIRASYESTFIDSAKTYRLSKTLKLNPDTLWHYLKLSRGNWRVLVDFISGIPEKKRTLIFPLLANISEKDLRDATPEVLTDNVENSFQFKPLTSDHKIIEPYILNPRVDNEWLKPYKGRFLKQFGSSSVQGFRANPETLVNWIKENIAVNRDANYGRAPLTPVGSLELKVTDPHSRDILFVALCRSFGIPARLEPGSRVVQYLLNGNWKDVWFENKPEASNVRGTLALTSDPHNERNPEYYTHYTVERFSDGFFRSLDYETDPQVKTFPCSLRVAPGYYLLVTGNRLPDGTVMASLAFMNVAADKRTDAMITLRKNLGPLLSLGKMDLPKTLPDLTDDKAIKVNEGKGSVIALLEPDKEPTKHFIAEIKMKKQDLSRWNGNLILLFRTGKEKDDFIRKNKVDLPDFCQFALAKPGATGILSSSVPRQSVKELPVVFYVNPDKVINYFSSGYRIGIPDEILKVIGK